MPHHLKERLEELNQFLENEDISLVSRRLMDFCNDFQQLDILTSAIELRATYNIKRGLGEGELKGDERVLMLHQFKELLNEINKRSIKEYLHQDLDEKVVVEAKNLAKIYLNKGHEFSFGPISFNLKAGEITGIVGENGNGKTTLLRMIAKDLSTDAGALNYHTLRDVENVAFDLKQFIGFIPQRLNSWNGTLIENLKFSAAIHGMNADQINERVSFVIHRLGLTRFQHLTWKQLSSGYKLRFELAKTLVWNPKILVLDEPIANLDLYAQQLFLQDLTHLAKSPQHPITIILSSQQLHEIEEISDQLVFLRNGKPIYVGESKSFGENRAENSFMISGDFNYQLVSEALKHIDSKRIEYSGKIFTIHVPTSITRAQFLTQLLQHQVVPESFRDISNSTRKLLSDAASL